MPCTMPCTTAALSMFYYYVGFAAATTASVRDDDDVFVEAIRAAHALVRRSNPGYLTHEPVDEPSLGPAFAVLTDVFECAKKSGEESRMERTIGGDVRSMPIREVFEVVAAAAGVDAEVLKVVVQQLWGA